MSRKKALKKLDKIIYGRDKKKKNEWGDYGVILDEWGKATVIDLKSLPPPPASWPLLEEEEKKMSEKEEDEWELRVPDRSFLVRATSSLICEEGKFYGQVDFYRVYLNNDRKLEEKARPSMGNSVGDGIMLDVCGGMYLYILGGNLEPELDPLVKPQLNPHTHLGGSRYDFISQSWQKSDIPEEIKIEIEPNLAVLSHVIYSFGLPLLRPQALLPNSNGGFSSKYLALPENLDNGTEINYPVVPDPDNHRILVHFPSSMEIYAFVPPQNGLHLGSRCKWIPIATDFSNWAWAKPAAVSDNILFFHTWDLKNLVRAYDLIACVSLKVVAEFKGIHISLREFDALFILPTKGHLCLVGSVDRILPFYDAPSVHFLRFRFKRTSDTQLKLTVLDNQSHLLTDAKSIEDSLFMS